MTIHDLHAQVALLQKEIAELKQMVQVLVQVAWLMSDESAKSIIDEDDWDLLYMESKEKERGIDN